MSNSAFRPWNGLFTVFDHGHKAFYSDEQSPTFCISIKFISSFHIILCNQNNGFNHYATLCHFLPPVTTKIQYNLLDVKFKTGGHSHTPHRRLNVDIIEE